MPNKIRLDNNAKADFNRPCCHDNTYCENIWAHMNNILETVYITVYCRKLVCTRFPFSALRDLVLPMFA